jgi:eukaryotic-like serine/threonine-protein kinase
LITERLELNTSMDVWAFPQVGDQKPFAYLNGEYNEQNAKVSPNGQWLAYASDESKRFEVYVQTFPEHGGKWHVSTNGGNFHVWSRDGH